MCNYEKSCEKPLLERKRNRDISHCQSLFYFKKWQVTFQQEHFGFCCKIYKHLKRFMANEGALKSPSVLLFQTYNLRNDPVQCYG